MRHQVKLAYCKECVGQGDIRRMLSKDVLPSVRESDNIMCTWRRLIEPHLPSDPDQKKALDSVLSYGDMNLAAFTLSLTSVAADLQKYKSAEALAHDLVLVMKGLLGVDLVSPWEAHAGQKDDSQASQGEKSSPSAAGSGMMRELHEDGSVKETSQLMAESGFQVGMHVKRKGDGECGCIQKILQGRVHLSKPDGTTGRLSVDSFLRGDWNQYTPKAQPELLEDLTVHKPQSFPDFQHAAMMADMILDLRDLLEKHHEHACHGKLHLQLKPRKVLLAAAFIGKNKLTLVPAGVQVKHGPKKPEDALFQIQAPTAGYYFWIQPLTVFPKVEGEAGFVNPAFFVQPLAEEEAVNMDIVYVKGSRCRNVTYPVLRNTKDLQQGDVLYLQKNKAPVQLEPLQADSPPKKRLRSKGALA